MSSPVTVHAVRTWLEPNRMGDHADSIVEIVGVDTVDVLELVTDSGIELTPALLANE